MKSKLSLFSALLFSFVLGAAVMSVRHDTKNWKPSDTKFDFGAILSHHLMDAPVIQWQIGGKIIHENEPGFHKKGFIKHHNFRDARGLYRFEGGLPLHLTKRVLMMFVFSTILMGVMIAAAQIISRDPYQVRGRFAGMIEVVVQYIRHDVVRNNMHGHGGGFEPYILSLFFFILFGNLFGLIPPLGEIAAATMQAIGTGEHHEHLPGDLVPLVNGIWSGIAVTGDVAVTLALALTTTIMTWVTGFRYQGFKFLWSFFPKGMPLPVLLTIGIPILFPLLFVLEIIISPLARGFALTIRLLANMTAGHVIILALIGFIFQFGIHIAPVAIVGAGAIYVLEIFVAFLQAFIFALLTAIFIGGTMHAH